jgi:tyrosinase
MVPRIRKSVYALAQNGPELTWYRRAVANLKSIPLATPGGWEFLAACHGIDPSIPTPPAANRLWRECQHQTWFFLPWHRGYVARQMRGGLERSPFARALAYSVTSLASRWPKA